MIRKTDQNSNGEGEAKGIRLISWPVLVKFLWERKKNPDKAVKETGEVEGGTKAWGRSFARKCVA